MTRRLLYAWTALLLTVVTMQPSARAMSEAGEAEIKAAFLCKFGNYIDWPASATPGRGPFAIAVAGSADDAFAVQRVASSATVAGEPIKVARLVPGAPLQEALRDARIVYVTRGESARVAEIASIARERSLLLVTESGEPPPGGMVNFVVSQNKVRFDIDLHAAAAAQLKISGRLLSVARKVTGAP